MAAVVPSLFATMILLILYTCSDAQVTIAALLVVNAAAEVCPVMVATFTKFGAAIVINLRSFIYPKIIAMAIALPVVAFVFISVNRLVPSSTNAVAVTIPAKEALPFVLPIVTAAPTEN